MLVFGLLCAPPSMAQEGAPETITMPKPLSISRFIPTGEERTVGFVASLFPDCTSPDRSSPASSNRRPTEP
jgi:hypothetical protein